jgi:hypothetical protein
MGELFIPKFTEYLELCGGSARLEELRRQELHPEKPG